jgi:putative ABC transport system permease protein
MLRLAFRQLLARRVSTAFAAAGLLLSTVGFIVLASTSQTVSATLRGDAELSWSSTFDLLVRPAGSSTTLETNQSLVRANYLSGLTGGITLSQLNRIRQVSGVEVAAPIAVVGFVNWPAGSTVDLQRAAAGQDVSVFRLTQRATGDAGLSVFPATTSYLVIAPTGTIDRAGLHVGSVVIPCPPAVQCLTAHDTVPGLATGQAGAFVAFDEPVLLAGIDPVAEAALTGAPNCVKAGRYLRAGDRPAVTIGASDVPPTVPVLASTTSFIDESVSVQVDESTPAASVLSGSSPAGLRDWRPVTTQVSTADALFHAFSQQGLASFYNTAPLEVPGDVKYQIVGDHHLAAQPAAPNLSVFNEPFGVGPSVPSEAQDTWFRSISAHQFNNPASGTKGPNQPPNRWQLVGQFDPHCFSGFGTSATSLLGYAPATVTTPAGAHLGPTRSVAGYVNAPPALLTTLDGAAYFEDPQRFANGDGDAFISTVRVRVSAAGQPGPIAEARLARVAANIHASTGLLVDVVKGSASQTVDVDLASGHFGRPAVTVAESWTAKGVVVAFVNSVSGANLALFSIILVGASILVGQTAYASMRRRQEEFGILRALGWSRRRIALLVELETMLLGAVTGVAAAVADVAITLGAHAGNFGWQLVISPLVAVGIAGLAALVPAFMVGHSKRTWPLRPDRKVRRRPHTPSLVGFAVGDLVSQWRTEAILGAGAVGLGGLLMGLFVLIALGFGGAVDAALLGTTVSAQFHSFHVVLGVLVLVIGALSAGQIVTLTYLERQPDFAVLRALGWHRRTVGAVIGTQAVVLGLAGGLCSGALVVAVGVALGASGGITALAATVALLASVFAAGIAATGPLLLGWLVRPATTLRSGVP